MSEEIITPEQKGFDRIIPRWILVIILGLLIIGAVIFVKYITWSLRGVEPVIEPVVVEENIDKEKRAMEEAQRQLEALDEATKDMPRPTLEESQKQLMELDAQTQDSPRPTEAELKAQLEALDAQVEVQ